METATAPVPDATSPAPVTAPADGTQPPPAEGEAAPGEEEKKEGENADEEDDKPKPMYEVFTYLDPRKYTPECTLKI